jgi:hypothetical protein
MLIYFFLSKNLNEKKIWPFVVVVVAAAAAPYLCLQSRPKATKLFWPLFTDWPSKLECHTFLP